MTGVSAHSKSSKNSLEFGGTIAVVGFIEGVKAIALKIRIPIALIS